MKKLFNILILSLFLWAVIFFIIGTCSCSQVHKTTHTEQASSDSTGRSHVRVDSTTSWKTAGTKETNSSTTWDDWFWTDSSSLQADVNPEDSTPVVVETETIKVTATKNNKGGVNLNLVQKPQKAHGKGSNTTNTKEQASTTASSTHSSDTKQQAHVSAASSTAETNKEKKGISWGVSAGIAIAVIIGLICLIIYLKKRFYHGG